MYHLGNLQGLFLSLVLLYELVMSMIAAINKVIETRKNAYLTAVASPFTDRIINSIVN